MAAPGPRQQMYQDTDPDMRGMDELRASNEVGKIMNSRAPIAPDRPSMPGGRNGLPSPSNLRYQGANGFPNANDVRNPNNIVLQEDIENIPEIHFNSEGGFPIQFISYSRANDRFEITAEAAEVSPVVLNTIIVIDNLIGALQI